MGSLVSASELVLEEEVVGWHNQATGEQGTFCLCYLGFAGVFGMRELSWWPARYPP